MRKSNFRRLLALFMAVLMLVMFTGCGHNNKPDNENLPDLSADTSGTDKDDEYPGSDSIAKPPLFNGLIVHIIDVGQGHSTLVESKNEFMLIDTGEKEYADTVCAYLDAHNVTTLKYVVATHPHSDHMGGMSEIIRKYNVKEFILPDVQNNSVVFEKMLEALNAKNTPVTFPEVGKTYELGISKFTILSPSSKSYSDLNAYSVGMRFEYLNSSFLIDGDATTTTEAEMLETGLNLKSDVMLVPHHGSESSSAATFIKAVSPKAAIISVGAGNSYNHPDQKIVDRYTSLGVKLYRTDKLGTIVVSFDGESYNIESEKTPSASTDDQPSTEAMYIGNSNSLKFHRPDCKNLPSKKNQVTFSTREDAVAAGYEPCGACNP